VTTKLSLDTFHFPQIDLTGQDCQDGQDGQDRKLQYLYDQIYKRNIAGADEYYSKLFINSMIGSMMMKHDGRDITFDDHRVKYKIKVIDSYQCNLFRDHYWILPVSFLSYKNNGPMLRSSEMVQYFSNEMLTATFGTFIGVNIVNNSSCSTTLMSTTLPLSLPPSLEKTVVKDDSNVSSVPADRRQDLKLAGVKITKVSKNGSNNHYNQVIDNEKVAKAGAIIECISTGRFLLVLGKVSGKWGFAKGCVEDVDNSSPFSTARREVLQEIGIDLLNPDHHCIVNLAGNSSSRPSNYFIRKNEKILIDLKNVVTSYNSEIVYFQVMCDSKMHKFKSMKTFDAGEIEKIAWFTPANILRLGRSNFSATRDVAIYFANRFKK
jgi:8-oxo-dGTP pyrophosphatase MutT (NUDIX family)